MVDKDKIALALSIISGRKTELDHDEYGLLGYDSYKFGYYGKPSVDDLKREAESILYECLKNGDVKAG